MKPNLPTIKVSTVIVDKNIHNETKKLISDLGIKIIETISVDDITDCTSSHPDMQFLHLGNTRALAAKQTYEYYKSKLPEFDITCVDKVYSPYPNDSLLNVTIVGEFCFTSKLQWGKLEAFIDAQPIFINQGYSKCNICILNENAIITSDRGIEREALKNGLRTYFLESNEIALDGYNNGFWGGSSGLVDRGRLLLNGNIEKLDCFDKLIDIFKKEKIEPVYHKEGEICDNGSIIPII